MMKQMKRLVSVFLVFAMMLSLVPAMHTEASKNKTAAYVSDYKKWNQGESAYSEMREVGCLITAQAKMIYEYML
ncbi:MAG: hypothetical protein MRZ45_11695, partial [Blautia sp.]|nr:hypothetical protein [Blautia sp.]